MIISRIGPQQYVVSSEAYDQLPKYLSNNQLTRILLLHGQRSLNAAKPYLPELPKDSHIYNVNFNGECSINEINRIRTLIEQYDIQVVIGLGGGKVLDTAKSASHYERVQLVLIPTLASNCSPWSSVSVHYKENGERLDHEVYDTAANLLLVNPVVILNSPVNYLIAGIADTLAKYYESELVFQHLAESDHFDSTLQISFQMAVDCRDVLLKSSIAAVKDMKAGQLTTEWLNVVETIIATAGTVGGWGDQYGRATGAHSVHDALTLFKETQPLLHGEKVAYGILVQLALEAHADDLRRLIQLFKKLNLPTNLKELGFQQITTSLTHQIAAESSSPDKTIHLLPLATDEQAVFNAIQKLEHVTHKLSV